MKVLLVYPKNPEGNFWYFDKISRKFLTNFKFLKFLLRFLLGALIKRASGWKSIRKKGKATFPPLGLLTVASMLPKAWELKLIDENVTRLLDSDIQETDMVFISAMLVQQKSAEQIIQTCKTYDKIVVAGGPLFSGLPDRFLDVDHIIIGEAENTLPLFLKDLEKKELKRIYKSEERPSLDTSPVPLWRLINLKDYVTLSTQFSRGCPFNCEFCDITATFGKRVRTKSTEQFLSELQVIYDAGYRGSIFFVDDNLIGNKQRAKEMLKKLSAWQKKRKYPLVILTQVSLNLAEDDNLIEQLVEANVGKVFIGIESPNPENLKACGKTQNINVNMISAVKKLLNHGLQVMGGFVYGFDNDNHQTCDSLIRFIQNSGIVSAMPAILTVLPGTQLEERLQRENRLLGESNGGSQKDIGINFIPRNNNVKELLENYYRLIKTIYQRKNYHRRINIFLKHYKHRVKGQKISWTDLTAFIKSVLYVGMFSKDCFYYWKVVFRLIFSKKIRVFPLIIEMMIVGRHYQNVANQKRV
ncbi:B12-binding domain-containing radical SAM protein [Patescibacteria group bacterium]|nr:B12-binding domain-containing radical SAM protein [Patescibacteria group bacterium]MBU1727877.1 B12-binding domain-containing radical SAM protein [Patescibacteria group bacterium]